MKIWIPWLALLCFALPVGTVALVSCGGCASNPAEQKVLLPAMRLSWPGVKSDIETGISIRQNGEGNLQGLLDALDTAIGAGDLKAIAASQWEVLEDVAQDGIAERVRSGQVTEGVANSLRERLTNFTAAIQELRS